MRLGSLFFTFPTRELTGQQFISSEGNGASRALSVEASAEACAICLPHRPHRHVWKALTSAWVL